MHSFNSLRVQGVGFLQRFRVFRASFRSLEFRFRVSSRAPLRVQSFGFLRWFTVKGSSKNLGQGSSPQGFLEAFRNLGFFFEASFRGTFQGLFKTC